MRTLLYVDHVMPDEFKDLPIAAEIVPAPQAIMEPARFANAARVVHDQHGFTLYFFVAPADLTELPESKQQIEEQLKKHRAEDRKERPELKLTAEAMPVAKLMLPAAVMPALLQALATNFATWTSRFAQGEQHGPDDKH
jgi:hypothetical protein